MAGGAADGIYPYDIPLADGGPRVPDEDDLGGVQIKNGDPPPAKGAERDADMDNVQTYTLAGLVRTGPMFHLSVEWDAGESEYVVAGMRGMPTKVKTTDFSFDNGGGTGDVIISWPDGTLPPLVGKPRIWCPDGPGYGWGTNGVNQVHLYLSELLTGNPTDINFEIDLYGT